MYSQLLIFMKKKKSFLHLFGLTRFEKVLNTRNKPTMVFGQV